MDISCLPHVQFGDTPELVDTLSGLILCGIKTATSSAYQENEGTIQAGHKAVVLDSRNKPVCVIETTKVEIIPFRNISVEFAYLEGEGDRSLEYWRKEHQRFFELQGVFKPGMLLLCEYFKVIYRF